jgi:exopolysaccharide biosynthesis polyprenyl glycosylphosphotransferase
MKRFLLFLGDIAVLYSALFLALLVRYGRGFDSKLDMHVLPFGFIFIVWILVFYIANLYELGLSKNNLEFFSALFYSIAINSVISIAFFYLIPFLGITPKTNLIIFAALFTILESSWRYGFNNLIAKSGNKNNTLIIGANPQSQDLYDFLLANPQLGYGALGIIDVEDGRALGILENLIKQKNVSTLILSPSVYKIPQIIDVFYRLLGFKINFHNLPDFYERVTGKIPLGAIDQNWFLGNLSEGKKRGYEAGKRIFDLIFSFSSGVVSLFLFPFIVLAIKLNSAGPILIRQKRVGKFGKNFTMVKFRTMVANAPDGSAERDTGAVWTLEKDPRITKVGRFLRKTRLDELPQLWNVLRGEMSFVGPRAERPEFHEELKEKVPFYEERYLIKPGLSGWAQIKFRYGSSVGDAAEKLQYDLYYIKNRTFFLDLGIILKTITIVLRKEGR